MEKLIQLFETYNGRCPAQVEKLPGAGSNRQYYRIIASSGVTVIGVVGTSTEENQTFVSLASHFETKGLPVPRILGVSTDGTRYLQTDLGNTSLFDALAEGRMKGGIYSEQEVDLLRKTISRLPEIQVKGAEDLNFEICYPQPEMDKMSVLFDLNYFKYCFLKATGLEFNEVKLEHDFQLLAEDLLNGDKSTFLYRDFQARNVMLDSEGNPFFIDFQGGRKGPLEYDVVSFLWQASARYSAELRKELIEVYLMSLQRYKQVDKQQFYNRLNLFVLFRTMQVLGAYGFRGYFERKKHFLDSIAPAVENMRNLLMEYDLPYSYLRSVLVDLVNMPRFVAQTKHQINEVNSSSETNEAEGLKVSDKQLIATSSKYDGKGELCVRVFSFSYKKGIPEDDSGNGGGYVFDCRSTHNPGRYEPYKKLTGLQEPVIKFLEDDGEILVFLESVYRLAEAHVERYMKRGFTDLMFSFGCTGGQHRSVYSAQHLAEHLNKKYGIEVRVCHREQGIQMTLPRRQDLTTNI